MKSKRGSSDHSSPRAPRLSLEPLEPRILLTAVGVGDWFVYKAGDRAGALDGAYIRVEVVNDVTGVGQAEVLRWDAEARNDLGDVAHIPGVIGQKDIFGNDLPGVDIYGGLPGRDVGEVIGSTPWINRLNVTALAVNSSGQYYGVDNDTGAGTDTGLLIRIDPATGQAIVDPALILDDAADATDQLVYNDILAMDFDGADTLWAVGTMVDLDDTAVPPAIAGLQLVTIDTATGQTTRQATLSGIDGLDALAFNGANLFAIVTVTGSTDQFLARVNTSSGAVSRVTTAPLRDASSGASITSWSGMEFFSDASGDTLYGVAGGNLYEIDPDNAACTLLGGIGVSSLFDLSYDANDPDYLWSIGENTAGDQLVRIIRTPPDPSTPFAIYFSESDAYTELRMTVVTPYEAPANSGNMHYDDLKLWNATNTPYLDTVPGPTPVYSPSGSGGVLVGAVPDPTDAMPDRYVPVTDAFPYVLDDNDEPIEASPLGSFPGGLLMGGISVAEPQDVSSAVDTINDPWGLGVDDVWSLAADSAGNTWGVDNETGALVRVSPVTGETIATVALNTGIQGLYIHGLDYDGTDVLWAVGAGDDGAVRLLQINTGTGVVTDVATIDDTYVMTSIAFDPTTGDLYGIDETNQHLVTIDTTTGDTTNASWNRLHVYGYNGWVTGIKGIDFTADGRLYGIDNRYLYFIDHATEACVPVLPTGVNSAAALAFSPTDTTSLWAIDSDAGPDKLVQLDLAFLSEESTYDVGTDISSLTGRGTDGFLYAVDNGLAQLIQIRVEDDFGENITTIADLNMNDNTVDKLAYDSFTGFWWAIGTDVGGDPVLLSITEGANPGNNWEVEVAATFDPGDDIVAIAFDSAGSLYGINEATHEVVIITHAAAVPPDPVTLEVVADLEDDETNGDLTDVTGIAFDSDDNLYVVADGKLYATEVVEDFWGNVDYDCTLVQATGLDDLSDLAFVSDQPDHMWTVSSDDESHVVRVQRRQWLQADGQGYHTGDLCVMMLGGTLAGRLNVPGSLEIAQLGFLYGSIDVVGDIRTVYIQTDAGGRPQLFNYGLGVDNSTIDAGGTIGDIYVRGTMYSSVYAGGQYGIPDPDAANVNWNDNTHEPILELEGRLPEVLSSRAGWGGPRVFARTYAMDVYGTYQLVAIPFLFDGPVNPNTSYATVRNDTMEQAQYLASEDGDIVLWGQLHSSYWDESDDFYALSLEAGQTVRIHGYSGHVTDPRAGGWAMFELDLIAPDGQIVGTFGYETVEDIGIGSRGSTQESLVFTAQEAGLYYIQIQPDGSGPYTVFIDGAAETSLGGMRINGDYTPAFGGLAPHSRDIYVGRADLGAVNTTGTAITASVYVERGSLLDFEADRIGYTDNGRSPVSLAASDNIGRVATYTGNYVGSIQAGANTGHGLNTAGDVQNLWIADSFNVYEIGGNTYMVAGAIVASGNIGWVHTGGDMSPFATIMANSDQAGPASTIDLLEIGGDWGAFGAGAPTLLHGPGGNVRFMNVDGVIYTSAGAYSIPANPTVLSGQSAVFADDGGGVMTITPGSRTEDDGNGGTIDINTTISFYIIPVDDAVGGVLAQMTIDGQASFDAEPGGVVEISELIFAGTNAEDSLNISGGQVDIYYLGGSTVNNVRNDTSGDIVSGNLAGVSSLVTGGSLGHTTNGTGARIPGVDARPDANDAAFGWFHGRLNGIQIGGSPSLVSAGASIGDLYFTGSSGRIVADSDGTPSAEGWDGVRGTVLAGTSVDYIDVGDGLLDDGSAPVAQAAIFSNGSIGTVAIGRRYEVLGDTVWGLINGAILAPDGIDAVTGTEGARTTAIIGSGVPTDFRPWTGAATFLADEDRGNVGTISFSGEGAKIYRAEIYGNRIEAVLTSRDSEGIEEVYITADAANPSNAAIGRVEAGGPGLIRCVIGANGGWIGPVKGIGGSADLIENFIESTDSVTELSGRHIYGNAVDAPRIIDRVTTTGNFTGNTIETGGIGRMRSDGDVLGNTFTIAGPVDQMDIGGEFYSTLILQGPTVAYLGSLEAVGGIGGVITSAGEIGSIISETGTISADITTTEESATGNVDTIEAGGAFTGNLRVSGSLGTLATQGHVGINPEDQPDLKPTVIDIAGNLDTLTIEGARQGPAFNLYSDLNIGGGANTIEISGGLFGDLKVNQDVEDLSVGADIGAQFLLPGAVTRGNVEVRGAIDSLNLEDGSDIVGDLITGGDISRISLRNSNIIGNITSLYGGIPQLRLSGGSIFGNITAYLSIGRVDVRGGRGVPVTIAGNLTSLHGGIDQLRLTGGDLDGSLFALGGAIGRSTVSGGNVGAGIIQAATAVQDIRVTGGNFGAQVTAGTTIGSLGVSGGTFTGSASAGLSIDSLRLGDVAGATFRSGGTIGRASMGAVTNTLISSRSNVDSFRISGNVDNTQILVGLDVGPDGLLDTADDVLHSGSLARFDVRGNFTNSTIALGMDRGADDDFLTVGDNTVAPGVSTLTAARISGNVAGSGIVADTALGRIDPAGIFTATVDTGDRGYALGAPATQVGDGAARSLVVIDPIDGDQLTISLSGGGTGSFYEPVPGGEWLMALADTTDRTSLRLSIRAAGCGDGQWTPGFDIGGHDDASLSGLTLPRGSALGDVDLDGSVRTLRADAMEAGNALTVLGGVGNFTINTAAAISPTIVAGKVGRFSTRGPINGGSITVDSLDGFSATGNVAADITTNIGGTGRMMIRNGDFTGDLNSRGPVDMLQVQGRNGVGGSVTGDIDIQLGDLGSARLSGAVTGNINVATGGIGRFSMTDGDFGNPANPTDLNAIRSLTGFDQFSITGGDFQGIIYTGGSLDRFTSRDSEMNGRLVALGGIGQASFDTMFGGFVASGTNIGRISIAQNMTDSYIFAGFDPGDDGFEAGVNADHNRDDAWLDAFTVSINDTVPTDIVQGGSIDQVNIRGNMVRSAISAAVGPGEDGYVGNEDDIIAGTGSILRASVSGIIEGSAGQESYGFAAATALGQVTVNRTPLVESGNVASHARVDPVGAPRVEGIGVYDDGVDIVFDQPIDLSSIRTPWYGNGTTTVTLIVSEDSIFGNADDFNISELVPHTITYDGDSNTLSMGLNAQSLEGLDRGTNFLLTLDGAADGSGIRDASGDPLDGEYNYTLPSGNDVPGGDFVYRFHYGDFGDTVDTAVDVTEDADKALLIYNTPTIYAGQIGDNDNLMGINRPNDVDVFRIDAVQGDILYVAVDNPMVYAVQVWTEAPWGGYTQEWATDSLSLSGYYTEDAAETYWVSVCTDIFNGVGDTEVEGSTTGMAIGSYQLYVQLFNDGNSNFDFDDATQDATDITFVGNVAEPDHIDAEGNDVQVINSPDDVDLYALGQLAEGTPIDVTVLTRTIGSRLGASAAVFNSQGELIASLAFPGGQGSIDFGSRETQYIDNPVIEAYAPATDDYYVAVWGGLRVSPFATPQAYDLSVEVGTPVLPVPTPPTQTVFLNFTGGTAAYLSEDFGDGADTYMTPFAAAVFGFDGAGETDRLIEAVVDEIEDIYDGYNNIDFITQRPFIGDYTEVIIGANIAPEIGVYGIADDIDSLNGNPNNMAVVFGGELASEYNIGSGYTLGEIGIVVGTTAAHELGHTLGLNHYVDPDDGPPTFLMNPLITEGINRFGRAPLGEFIFNDFGQVVYRPEFLIGYQNDTVLLRVIA